MLNRKGNILFDAKFKTFVVRMVIRGIFRQSSIGLFCRSFVVAVFDISLKLYMKWQVGSQ